MQPVGRWTFYIYEIDLLYWRVYLTHWPWNVIVTSTTDQYIYIYIYHTSINANFPKEIQTLSSAPILTCQLPF